MIGDDHEDNEEFNSYIEDEDAHDNQDIQLANDSHIADERLHPVDSPMKMDGDNDKDIVYNTGGDHKLAKIMNNSGHVELVGNDTAPTSMVSGERNDLLAYGKELALELGPRYGPVA